MTDEDGKDATTQLAQNSTLIDFESAKGSLAWSAAKDEGGDAEIVERSELGRFAVEFQRDDEEQSEVLLVKSSGDEFAGGCLCKENRTHTRPCRHLCTLRIEDAMGDVDVPVSGDYVESLAFSTAAEARGDPQSSEESAEASESESSGGEDAGASETPAVQQEPPAPPQQTDDAFANPLPEVDDKFAMDMDGSTYVRKAGYARLLAQQGWIVERDFVAHSWDEDGKGEDHAVVEAMIIDPESGRVLSTAIGTAGPPEAEDMTGAEHNLDELAETRAWTRAASIATGEGMTALSEVHPDKEVSEGA